MSVDTLISLGTSLMVGIFAGLGSYVAVRVEIAVLTEKIDRTVQDLDHLKSKLGEL